MAFGAFVMLCSAPLIAAIALLVVQERRYHAHVRMLRESYSAYGEALLALRTNPNDTDLRRQALHAGRRYVALTHHQRAAWRRVAVDRYAETAVLEDIQLMTTPLAALTIEERLADVDQLHAKGIISDGEHAARRQHILDTV
jgi:hypothetical protein